MVKATTKAAQKVAREKAASKKEFAWDSAEGIGMYTAGEKEQHTVELCTLKGTLYVVDTKLVLKQATGWTPVKNTTIRLDNFEKLVELVSDWKLKSAFTSEDGAVSISVGAEEPTPKKRTRKTTAKK